MNPDLERIQNILRELGYLITDFSVGELDAATGGAIQRFQVAHRLPITGEADERTAEEILRALDRREFVVFGHVVDADGPLPGVTVTIQDRDLGEPPWQVLGEDATGLDGLFVIRYDGGQFSAGDLMVGEMAVPDLVFSLQVPEPGMRDFSVLRMPGDRRLSNDDVELGLQANRVEQVRIVVEMRERRSLVGESEFERLLAKFRSVWPERDPGSIDERRRRELSFVARELDEPLQKVEALVHGFNWSAGVFRSDITPKVLYGLARSHRRLNTLQKLGTAGEPELKDGLEQAMADRIISPLDDDQIHSAIRTILNIAPDIAASSPDVDGLPTFGQRLASGVPDAAAQSKLLRTFGEHSGDTAAFWTQLRSTPEFADAGKVERAQFALQLDALTQSHLPLMNALQADTGLKSTRDLLEYGEDRFREILAREDVGIPVDVPGDTAAVRIDNYVSSVMGALQLALPTESVALALRRAPDSIFGGERVQNAVGAFFQKATSQEARDNGTAFDIRTSSLNFYMTAHGDVMFAGVTDEDRAQATANIGRAQRLFHVSTDPKAFDILMQSGFSSARDIASMPQQTFVQQFGETMGPQQAMIAHSNAVAVSASSVYLYVALNDLIRGANPSAVDLGDPDGLKGLVATHIPEWQQLFGSPELCACAHCRSVYSPAAYLVDILHFLEESGTNAEGLTPLDVLIGKSANGVSVMGRRPDLAHLKLTCENTNTAIPYVDLVNEILECLALSWATVAETDGRIVVDRNAIAAHDTGTTTTPELKASPQFVLAEAYETPNAAGARERLDRVAWPLTLPYDAPLEAVRVYLQYLGVPTASMVEQFAKTGEVAAALVESLRISPNEFAILTGKTLDGTSSPRSVDDLYGYTPELMPRLEAGASGLYVAALKRKLNTGGAGLALAADPAAESFDAATVAAVNALQTANSLTASGIVSIPEWRVLHAVIPVVSSLQLPNVRELLERTGVSYEDLVHLCEMRFLNPERDVFAIVQRLELPQGDLITWINAGLAGDPGTAIKEALSAAKVPLADFTTWAQEHLQGATWERAKGSFVLESPIDDPCNLDRTRLRHWDEAKPELTPEEWQRFNRTIRLWRKLGWTLPELDRALVALDVKEIDADAIQQLARVQRTKLEFDLPVDEVTLFWALPDVTSETSFFNKRFLNKAALRNDPVFAPDWKGDVLVNVKISEHLTALLAGLRLKADQLDAIVKDALPPAADALTLENLGKVAAYAILSRALGLPVPDLVTLRQLSGLDPFTKPTASWSMSTFVDLVRLVQASDLSVPQLDYLFRGGSAHALAPDAARVELALDELYKGLAGLAAEFVIVDDPHGETSRARLSTLYTDAALVGRVAQMIDGSATYTAPLATMPGDVVWPTAFAKRFWYDETAQVLVVQGAITSTERLSLRVLSTATEFATAIDALAAAPRTVLADLLAAVPAVPISIPTAEATLVDVSSFNAQGQVDAAAVAAKFAHVLSNVLPPLHDAARRAFIKQTLTDAFGFDAEILARLVVKNDDGSIVLHAMSAPAEPIIVDFFDSSAVVSAKRSWLRLHKTSLLVNLFKPTTTELGFVAAKLFDFDQLPDVVPTAYNPSGFGAYRKLAQYAAVKKSLPSSATPLAAVFGAATLPEALQRLADASGRSLDRLESLAGAQGFTLTLAGVQDVAGIAQLLAASSVLDRLGISSAQAFAWARQPITAATADEVRRAARAKVSEDAWLGIAKKLNDPLREGRRDALIAYLLPRLGLKTSSQLYEQLLIDVEMGACMMTSRVKQAAASVQLFVQRCLMNLEAPRVLPSAIDQDEWKWMRRYRVWEANRKVFLYPENWIEPELRDDKTPFFKELENEILQNDVTDANVERALLGYLEKLNAVAKLRMCGMCVQTNFEPGEKLKEVVHVFGRTLNTPYAYYYRRYVLKSNDIGYWTPWERVPVDVRGDQIAPVIYNRRLYLFWYLLTQKAEESSCNSSKPTPPEKYDELQIAWSEYSGGNWSPKYVSDPGRALRLSLFGTRRFDAYVSGDTLSVVYSAPSIQPIGFKPTISVDGTVLPPRMVTEYHEKAEGKFEFDNCHGTLELRTSGWTQSFVSGYGVNPWDVQPLGNGMVETVDTLTRNTTGAIITEEHLRHEGSDYFAYEDSHRVYFGHVTPKWREQGKQYFDGIHVFPDIGKFGEMLANPYDITTDLGRPYFSAVSKTATAEANPWLASTATLNALALQTTTTASMYVIDQPSNSAAALRLEKDAYSLISDFDKFVRATDAEVRYEIGYHPFTCAFLAGLNRYGVPGLLNLANQQLVLVDLFNARYGPTGAVVAPYPVEYVDFGRIGATSTYQVTAYSTYNWELFFHAPIMVAVRLSENQHFEEAMRWFHYVFNPTDGAGGYWKVLPFRTTPKERINDLLKNLNAGNADAVKQVAEWRDHPFQPHLIARMRLIAYQKHVVMKYMDNLVAWADQLFRQDTIETINEATQLYVKCAALLGPRPQQVPARGEAAPTTFAELRGKLDAFSNAMVSFENTFPSYSAPTVATSKDAAGLLGIGRSFYFCIPQNDKLIGYWDTIADRLLKIRHCMNIEGVVRELPLFEPPIDPALLVRAAARGVDLGSILNDLNSPAPFYRFTHVLQKAVEVCQELKSLGAQLLAALDRRDAEHLALLKQQHEHSILTMVRLVREKQIEEAESALESLHAMRRTAITKYQHYQGLLGAESGPAPEVGAEIPKVSARRKTSASGGAHLIAEETGELNSTHSARDWQVISATTETLAGVLHYIPNFAIKVAPIGVGTQIEIGGRHIGPAMGAIARFQRSKGEQDTYDASHFRRMAEHTRREQQWTLDSNNTAGEIMHIDKQILGLDIKLAIARQELINQERQVTNAEAAEEFLRSKYTNEDLYSWIQGQASHLFFRTYQIAYDYAKQAERAFQFGLGLTSSDFIRFGSWDSLRRGLMSGEQLSLQLRQLERAWHDQNRREYEVTKHVSLLQVDPQAFIRLKETGTCEFEIPEAMFDLDFPGHYFRRLKTVAVSIPCAVGPYTSISATLTLLNHRVRTDAKSSVPYPEKPGDEETRFSRDYVPMQSIAVSSATNDSGVFELNFRDERNLPFEGMGAISRWRLQLPLRDQTAPDKNFAQFDYETIADVVLHLKYTAREGGDALATRVRDSLKQQLNELMTLGGEGGLVRLFSLRHEYPNDWHQARQPGEALTIEIRKDRLPYFVQARKVTVQAAFRATGLDTLTPLADPEFVPAKNLWKLVVTPETDATNMLVMLVYTIA